MLRTPHRIVAVIVLAFLLCAATGSGHAAQAPKPSTPKPSPPLIIGGTNFRIGMSRQEAMALIAECCRTQGVNESGMFLHQKTGDWTILGKIHFANGRVSELVADVAQNSGRDTSDLVLALYRSILNGRTVAEGPVTISAFPSELSNATQRHILLTYPDGRKLRITQFAVDNGAVGARITEER